MENEVYAVIVNSTNPARVHIIAVTQSIVKACTLAHLCADPTVDIIKLPPPTTTELDAQAGQLVSWR